MSNPNQIIEKMADNIRILSAAMVEKAKSGHPGGPMGGADFMAVLYSEFLRYDPDDMKWPLRDRFFLDPGHMSAMLYATLHMLGHYTMDDLQNFRQWESLTPGHPELDVEHGIENTSGPLGMGHAMALGAAIAERFLASRFGTIIEHTIYTYISDGGIQEEISQGVGRLAGHLGLGNFIMFYDSNDIQLSTETSAVTSENTAEKYSAWGWAVETIDGHNIDQIRQALQRAKNQTDKPSLIIGKTIMGKKAVSESGEPFEGKVSIHGAPLSKAGASFEKTIENCGGNPAKPFSLFPEVVEFCTTVRKEKSVDAEKRKSTYTAWVQEHAEKAHQFTSFLRKDIPSIDYSAITQKPDSATRSAGGAVLGVCAEHVANMIVSSADLSNSDNTQSFLKKTSCLAKGDFSGAFLQMGVSELTMAAVMNGIALHGGVIPVCGTFFAFSDYMKPAIRLAALMGLPVKYVWTHDAFRVGEDGPTHQPVEQEAQIRLLEKMDNLKGKRSMTVLRPADADETTVAWKIALSITDHPVGLILSRQPIKSCPAPHGKSRYEQACAAQSGAYIVSDDSPGKPDIILLANGSEVSTLLETAALLRDDTTMKIRVVSVPSEGLFYDQSEDYRRSIVVPNTPVFGLTAGLAVTLNELVGPRGRVFGMKRFGASAPYKVLDEKFGFRAETIAREVLAYLEDYRSNT